MNRNQKILVPEARNEVNNFKNQIMEQQGFISKNGDIKYEVANELGINLNNKYNGDIKAKQAGQIGGKIGGSMVKEMVRMAEQQLINKTKRG